MMGDEGRFCGGVLRDASTCDVCYFDPALMQWVARVRAAAKDVCFEIPIRSCPECGTRLGVTADGDPTRVVMVPEGELERMRLVAIHLRQQVQYLSEQVRETAWKTAKDILAEEPSQVDFEEAPDD